MATIDPGQSTDLMWSADDDGVVEDDYLEDPLPGRPLRQRMGPFTVITMALALAAAAFFGGVLLEKHNVKASSTSASAANLARLRAAFTGSAAAGAPTAARGVTGTITLVDGSNVYVTQSDGSIVKVVTSPNSQFTVTSAGTVANLHPGDDVNVTGPTDANGDVQATAVRDNGAGGGGAGGGGGRRAAGGGAGAATGGGAAAPAGG